MCCLWVLLTSESVQCGVGFFSTLRLFSHTVACLPIYLSASLSLSHTLIHSHCFPLTYSLTLTYSLPLQASSPSDTVCFVIESRNQHKVSEYNIRQLDLDAEHLDIPETDYDCVIRLPSAEFQRICRDLSQIGESVIVDCAKEGVSFAAQVGLRQLTLSPRAGARE